MDEVEQYSLLEFYYVDKIIWQNANFPWEESEAKQGSQGGVEAFLIG